MPHARVTIKSVRANGLAANLRKNQYNYKLKVLSRNVDRTSNIYIIMDNYSYLSLFCVSSGLASIALNGIGNNILYGSLAGFS